MFYTFLFNHFICFKSYAAVTYIVGKCIHLNICIILNALSFYPSYCSTIPKRSITWFMSNSSDEGSNSQHAYFSCVDLPHGVPIHLPIYLTISTPDETSISPTSFEPHTSTRLADTFTRTLTKPTDLISNVLTDNF